MGKFAYTHVSVLVCMYIVISMCICTCLCIRIYSHSFVYVHAYIHTRDDSNHVCSLQMRLSVLLSCYSGISTVSPKSTTKGFFCSLSWRSKTHGLIMAELQVSDE